MGYASFVMSEAETSRSPMLEATVKWYSVAKGYGFVVTEESEGDVFVHHSLVNESDDGPLEPGERVLVAVTKGDRGLQATRLQRLD